MKKILRGRSRRRLLGKRGLHKSEQIWLKQTKISSSRNKLNSFKKWKKTKRLMNSPDREMNVTR